MIQCIDIKPFLKELVYKYVQLFRLLYSFLFDLSILVLKHFVDLLKLAFCSLCEHLIKFLWYVLMNIQSLLFYLLHKLILLFLCGFNAFVLVFESIVENIQIRLFLDESIVDIFINLILLILGPFFESFIQLSISFLKCN